MNKEKLAAVGDESPSAAKAAVDSLDTEEDSPDGGGGEKASTGDASVETAGVIAEATAEGAPDSDAAESAEAAASKTKESQPAAQDVTESEAAADETETPPAAMAGAVETQPSATDMAASAETQAAATNTDAAADDTDDDLGVAATADDASGEADDAPDHAQDTAERVTVDIDVSARGDKHDNDAAFAHAPTGAPPGLVAAPDDDLQEPDGRRNDFLWWLLTPISVLLAAPLVVLGTTFLVALTNDGYPAICQDAAPDNMCEEVVLRMAAQHTVAFGIGWLLLWVLPWRRNLRAYRIGLAVVIVAILLAAPLRLFASVDYQALLP